MNFTQTARGIVRTIALMMAVAVPLAITIEAADARVGKGGSSGSPVLNANGQLVGQLYGACGSNLNDNCDNVNSLTGDGALANVAVIAARHGVAKPNESSTAVPGMFCDAIVTMYRGTAMPSSACHVHAGAVRSIEGFNVRDCPPRDASCPRDRPGYESRNS